MTNELEIFLKSVDSKKVINTSNKTFIFNVKPECKTDLVDTGIFNGTERMIRITEFYSDDNSYGDDHVFTIVDDNGNETSYHSGPIDADIISFNTKMELRLIREAIKEKFGETMHF